MNRTGFLNNLIRIYAYESYLEIGVDDCGNFNGIDAFSKISCDPSNTRGTPTHLMTSDAFFKINNTFFDLVFVDGLHTFEQSYRDVVNSFKWLNERGSVVLHDTYPREYGFQAVPQIQTGWTGDVWKTVLKIQLYHPEWNVKSYDVETGMTVLQRISPPRAVPDLKEDYTYEYFEKNSSSILNLHEY